jgi:hypothetical protein
MSGSTEDQTMKINESGLRNSLIKEDGKLRVSMRIRKVVGKETVPDLIRCSLLLGVGRSGR